MDEFKQKEILLIFLEILIQNININTKYTVFFYYLKVFHTFYYIINKIK